ncbi:tRNA (pseudouridine(54)-N(1))-methyltransferase TrmY [Candidatus Woesearchaeota archaeon]|nr:tRNA (pseudouridine(54)-N(1))-methyltransferase TrmY [Candidatus Woesearchaeota archaeon]
MREFIVRVLKGKTTPDFSVESLVGAGRLDLVCRCIMNALCVANDIRRDTIIHISLDGPSDPPKIISFAGETIQKFQGDERSTAGLLKQALAAGKGLRLNEAKEVSPGITIIKKSFEQLVREKTTTSRVYYLHQKGADIRKTKFKEKTVIVLGDYIGMPRKSENLLENLNAVKISLGPIMLFASQCITVVHNELDRQNE